MEPRERRRSGILAQRQALIARQLSSTPDRAATPRADDEADGGSGSARGGGDAGAASLVEQAARRARLAEAATPGRDGGAAAAAATPPQGDGPRGWDTPLEQRPVVVRADGDTPMARYLQKETAREKLAEFARLVRGLDSADRREVTREAGQEVGALLREAGLEWGGGEAAPQGGGTPQPAAQPRQRRERERPSPVEVQPAARSLTPRPVAAAQADEATPLASRRARAAAAAEARATAAAHSAAVYKALYGPEPVAEPAYHHQERGSPDPEQEARDEREADEMVECAHCRRTFLPERLEIHLRSCRPGRAARPVGSLRSSAAARASGGQEHGGVSAARRSIAALGAAAARLPPASPSPTSGPGWAERERALAPQPEPEPELFVDYFSHVPDELKMDILTYVGPPYGEARELG